MKDFDEKSYERYKQYRLNKYTYEQEQKTLPFAIILVGAVIMTFWKQIFLGITIIAFAVFAFFLMTKHFSKRMRSAQNLVISAQEAQNGTEIEATVRNTEKPTKILLKIPPNTKNGQKYIAKNVEIQNKSEKRKVNIYFVIEIKD